VTNPGSYKMSVAEAREKLLTLVRGRTMGVELAPLDRAAGRILARPISTRWPLPGRDNSAMDGLLSLPGNPASAAVTFELFDRVALLALQGAIRLVSCITNTLTVRRGREMIGRCPPPLPRSRSRGRSGSS
jgi:molybdopterin biosynthesis enzyme